MRSNPIKYLEGTIEKASKAGLKHDYLFFMQLKSFCDSGYFYKKNYLKQISCHLNINKATIRERFKSMVDNEIAIIVYDKNNKHVGYQLLSYDKLWQKLGFEPKRSGRGYKNANEIIKIPHDLINSKNKLLEVIYHFDQYRLEQRLFYIDKRDNKPCRAYSEGGYQISQRAMANRLGLKTRMAACKIQSKLRKQGLMSVQNNSIMVDKMHITTYLNDNVSRLNPKTFYIFDKKKKGMVNIHMRLCNTLLTSPLSFFNDNKLNHINGKSHKV